MAFPTGWNRRWLLEIESSQVSANETNLEVLLTEATLPSEMFDADGANPALNGGGDIRFSSDEAGLTQLPLEVVSFVTDNDPANGTAELWVKVPSVSSSTETSIYVWFNKAAESQPARDNAYGSDNVWSSNSNEGVWHLLGLNDSTVNDETMSAIGNGPATGPSPNGKIDGCYDLEKTNADALQSSDPAPANLRIVGDLTITAWIKLESTAAGVIFGADGGSEAQADNTLGWIENLTGGNLRYLHEYGSGTNQINSFGTSLSAAVWYKIVLRREASTKDVHLTYNTTSPAKYTYTTAPDGGGNAIFSIGSDHSRSKTLDALVDECRVTSGFRSADWVITSYNNENSPATFISVISGGTPVTDETAPTFGGANPADTDTGVALDSTVYFELTDDDSGVDEDTITVTIDGNAAMTLGVDQAGYSSSINTDGLTKEVTITPDAEFDFLDVIEVVVDCDDNATNSMIQETYSFTVTADLVGPTGIEITSPTEGQTGLAINHEITWSAGTDPSPPIMYFAERDTVNTFDSANLQQSGWISELVWTPSVNMALNTTYYFRVKGRDSAP